MIKNKDIIIIGIQAWDIEIGSNCKNIALEFAKHNRVLYVNPPMDRISMMRGKKSERIKKRIQVKNGKEPDLVKIGENIWNLYPKTTVESINWIGVHSLFKYLNKRNTRLFAKDIKSAVSRLKFANSILFNDSSMFLGLHLQEYINPELSVYYMRDYLIDVPYWKRHGAALEPEVIKKAEVILNNSVLYTEYGSKYNPNSYMVGQGCDVAVFNDDKNLIPIPDEFEGIPSPVIGYVGSLTSLRLDIPLLEFMANQRKEWSIVLVGPEDEDFKNSSLHELPNVHFFGSKDSQDLPAYVKGFDVAMNPQLVNKLTIGNYPRKIDEYLAMGKPTVATQTKAMEMFQEHVYLGSSKEDYIRLIEKALAQNSSKLVEGRKQFANSHTWENNVKAIYTAIIESTKHRISWT